MPMNPREFMPHRRPFLFVDEFDVSENGRHVRASYLFRDDECFVPGHFPGNPVVPGVILVEAMAQCGGCGLVKSGMAPAGAQYFLAGIDSVKFRRPVRPGDRFDMEVDTDNVRGRFYFQSGQGLVNGEPAVEAKWLSVSAAPGTSGEQGR